MWGEMLMGLLGPRTISERVGWTDDWVSGLLQMQGDVELWGQTRWLLTCCTAACLISTTYMPPRLHSSPALPCLL